MIRNCDSTKRILFVIGSLELGGAEYHLVQVTKNLKTRGWHPELFVMNFKGPLIGELESQGIPIHYSKKLFSKAKKIFGQRVVSIANKFQMFLCLYLLLLKNKFHVIHFFLPTAYVFGGLTSLLTLSRPRIMSRRSMNNYQMNHPFLRSLEHFLHPRMDIICANSKVVAHQLTLEGVKTSQLELIYNGVCLERYKNPMNRLHVRKSLSVEADALLLIVVANLIPYKGHQDLLKALSIIKDDLPLSWRCLFVGRDDGIGMQLHEMSVKLGLENHLLWLGSTRDIVELQFAADIGILPSHQEGFSNAVIEGLAAYLPMIVSDVGGNSEAVENGISGIVYKAGDISELAISILSMCNEDKRRNFGQRGRERVEREFNLPVMIERYEEMYLHI